MRMVYTVYSVVLASTLGIYAVATPGCDKNDSQQNASHPGPANNMPANKAQEADQKSPTRSQTDNVPGGPRATENGSVGSDTQGATPNTTPSSNGNVAPSTQSAPPETTAK